ncbi:LacI family DNA-binding transcriptional regulator [Niabella yanshanensis]|uniref:LacI family DNA-binding transcriptional regulator n=1 Tax=Niabella yanshanensis TaxID=577386 RepID=A0ABZ0W7W7_9BACT|nr:LacI family DNA-binding transcriptional regulator [Niabella yanshanensis]WQD38764.1 LacI family DNA-binding transcriptional regulator [Niabella yanshanensis]
MEEKDVTIYDIARELDLASSTISRALKNDPKVKLKTRNKVHQMAQKMGYQSNPFARSLRNKRSYLIGIIIPRLTNHFVSSAISGLEDMLSIKGYNIIIGQTYGQIDKEISALKMLMDNRVDGLLVSLSDQTKSPEHLDPFTKKKIPLIYFDSVPDITDSSVIVIDHAQAAYIATKHLIEAGCKKIAHVTTGISHGICADKYAGYKKALLESNKRLKEELLVFEDLGSIESGKHVADHILKMNKPPDGLFFENDHCAAGCIAGLKKGGLNIPKDIAVVGFNDEPVATLIDPNLSSISYSGYEIGRVAAQNILLQIENPEMPKISKTVLPARLVIRESSIR